MQIHKLCFLALFLALFCSHITFAVEFNFKTFDGTDLLFLGDAELGASSDGVGRSGAFSMTRDENPFSHGQGLYANPIPFKPTNSSAAPYSFETSFTFSISPRTKPISGHGLAFIIVPVADNSGAAGSGFLGILNKTNNDSPENHLFAVEFDVFQDKSFGDINDNHVGLDVNSVSSLVAEKAGYWVQTIIGKSKLMSFKEVRLSNGERYKAWIEYRNSKVTVTLAPENVEKPKRPLIEATRNLSQVFLQNMYTGFAGAMGRGVQRHDIWSWSFENSSENN